jgi:glycosyltransferase involved in cell wall biosynthesis
MKVAIDAVGIRGHGGAAVLCELLYWLPKVKPEWQWHVFLFERDLREFDDPPVSDCVALEHTRFGNKGWERLKWVRRQLQDKIKSVGADLLFSFANIASNNPCVPQIVFVQQPNAFFDEGVPKRNFLKHLRMKFMRREILAGAKASRAVIVQTEAMHSRMLKYAPELNGRIHVIPSGFRTPSLNPVIRPEISALIESAGRPRLIYVSHPSEHKNHINLIKSLPEIIKLFPNTQLLLTLEKSQPPNVRYTTFIVKITKTAKEFGVDNNLVWLGILTPDEVNYALSNSNLMVFPSLAESFGLGIVEAMATGCPVIASNLPYAHDVAGDAAAYFDPLSPKDIARTVVTILSDRQRLAQMREMGLSMKEKYSNENIAKQVASLLQQVSS